MNAPEISMIKKMKKHLRFERTFKMLWKNPIKMYFKCTWGPSPARVYLLATVYLYKQTQVQSSELKKMLMLILKLSFLGLVGIIQRK